MNLYQNTRNGHASGARNRTLSFLTRQRWRVFYAALTARCAVRVAPNMGSEPNRAWDKHGNISPASGARFLELADIALGVKKPAFEEKKAAAASSERLSAKKVIDPTSTICPRWC